MHLSICTKTQLPCWLTRNMAVKGIKKTHAFKWKECTCKHKPYLHVEINATQMFAIFRSRLLSTCGRDANVMWRKIGEMGSPSLCWKLIMKTVFRATLVMSKYCICSSSSTVEVLFNGIAWRTLIWINMQIQAV